MTVQDYYQQAQESFSDREDCKERSAISVLYRYCEEMSFSQRLEFGLMIDDAETDNEIDIIVRAIRIVVELV